MLMATSSLYLITVLMPYALFLVIPVLDPDILSLILYIPLMGVLYVAVVEEIAQGAPEEYRYASYVALCVHFEGHGFHWAANRIHNFMPQSCPAELLSLVYLLDEVLGHAIMFCGLIAFFSILSVCELKHSEHLEESVSWCLPWAALFGLCLALSFLEGIFVLGFIVLSLVYVALVFAISRGRIALLRRTFTMFWLLSIMFTYIWIATYATFFGLRQPSEILR